MSTVKTAKKRRWRLRHDWAWMVAFVVPAALLVIAVQFYPLLFSAYLATQDWTLTSSQFSEGFVGLQNFAKVLQNEVFQRAVRNSALITGTAVVLEMIIGTALAYLAAGSSRIIRAVRTLLILPLVIAPVAAGTLWRMMLNSQMGLTNYLLSFLGIQGPDWLGNADWALVSVIIVDVWMTTPFVLLVVLAGVSSIPEELHESAALDGASRWKSFLYIDIPLMAPLLLLTFLFRMLESLLSLDSIYTLTLGGPGYATFTMTYYIYTLGLRSFNLGMAAAASWLFMSFATLALLVVFWLQRRWQTAQ
ncbi:MAG: sugar ABC transporter permease [Anaerolineae bacterium]|nr:sugar ABC transporter permease [Anaerolineae bacterium]MDW8071443.1 sugar ABC transporter permease [Anaerolineae bacterium]